MASVSLIPPATKVCRDCGQELPITAFGVNNQLADRRMSMCKVCYKATRNNRVQIHHTRSSSTKFCPICRKEKPASDYYIARQNADGLYSYCRACKTIKDRARVSDPAWREAETARHRMRRYGVTSAQVDAQLAAQNNLCAICGEPPTSKGWCVDHNHTTGKVRGILCLNCNLGVGNFKENPAALQSAIYYLALHETT